jgi:hypothetical protein
MVALWSNRSWSSVGQLISDDMMYLAKNKMLEHTLESGYRWGLPLEAIRVSITVAFDTTHSGRKSAALSELKIIHCDQGLHAIRNPHDVISEVIPIASHQAEAWRRKGWIVAHIIARTATFTVTLYRPQFLAQSQKRPPGTTTRLVQSLELAIIGACFDLEKALRAEGKQPMQIRDRWDYAKAVLRASP